jgi:hypothetical protein
LAIQLKINKDDIDMKRLVWFALSLSYFIVVFSLEMSGVVLKAWVAVCFFVGMCLLASVLGKKIDADERKSFDEKIEGLSKEEKDLLFTLIRNYVVDQKVVYPSEHLVKSEEQSTAAKKLEKLGYISTCETKLHVYGRILIKEDLIRDFLPWQYNRQTEEKLRKLYEQAPKEQRRERCGIKVNVCEITDADYFPPTNNLFP